MAPPISTQSLRSLVGRIIYSSNGNDIECSVCGTDTNLVLINEYQKHRLVPVCIYTNSTNVAQL